MLIEYCTRKSSDYLPSSIISKLLRLFAQPEEKRFAHTTLRTRAYTLESDPRSAPDYGLPSQEYMRILCTLYIVFIILFSCNDMTKYGDGTHGEGEESHQQQGHKDDEKKRGETQNTHVGGASSTISMA